MKEHKFKFSNLAVLLPILAGTCWGIVGFFIRLLEDSGLNNQTVVLTRTVMCTILVFIVLMITDRSKFRVKPKDLLSIFAIGIIGSVFLMIFYNIAVATLSLSMAAILLSFSPIFVLLISAIFFGEKITRKKVICMVFAIAGCALLSGIFEETSTLSWSMKGCLMGILAALCNCIYVIISKTVATKGYSSWTVCFYASLVASVILSFFADWGTLIGYVSSDPPKTIGILLTQAIISSLLPTMIYIIALRHLDAGKTSILQSGAEPTSAMLLGFIVYSEVPSLIGFIGMAMAIGAIMVLAGDEK